MLNGGLSFGYYYKYDHKWDDNGLRFHYLPPFVFQLERGTNDNPDLGMLNQQITWGIFAGFNKKRYDIISSTVTNVKAFKEYTFVPLGVSCTLHCTKFLNDELDIVLDKNKYDLYISLKGGIVYEHYHSNYDLDPHDPKVSLDEINKLNDEVHIYLAPQIGGRYYFYTDFAAFAELGYFNLSFLTIGVTYNFQAKK